MKLEGSIALVTGANRGLGRMFAQVLIERGAAKVYAAARNPDSIDLPGVVPLRLDVTDALQVADAARQCADITLLINNAGIFRTGTLDADDAVAVAREQMNTNYFGVLAMCHAFAPLLAANGGGAIANMLSALSWATLPGTGAYSASKSAAWALTNDIRQTLAAQGTQVLSIHAGYIDTDMVANVSAPKSSPRQVVMQTLDALEADASEVLVDDISREVKHALTSTPPAFRVA
jgi:NAD(P)-dependent dehydrogenase (short-subunit alcohol dehydrogenase family)